MNLRLRLTPLKRLAYILSTSRTLAATKALSAATTLCAIAVLSLLTGCDKKEATNSVLAKTKPQLIKKHCDFTLPSSISMHSSTLPSNVNPPSHSYFELEVNCFSFTYQGASAKQPQSLAVTVLTPKDTGLNAEPLLYLTGGPGDAPRVTDDNFYHWLGWFETAQLRRPLILVDLPGTGLSKPFYRCARYDSFSASVIGRPLSQSEELTESQKILTGCFNALEQQGFTPFEYSTARTAQTLKVLLESLGHQRYGVYGVSYGTRLALELAAISPEQIKALLLDSPYPHGQGLHKSQARLYINQIKNFLNQGVNLDKLNLILDLASKEQPEIQLNNSPNIQLTPHRLLSWLFWMGLRTERITSLIELINAGPSGLEVASESYRHWQYYLGQYLHQALSEDFSSFVYFATECTDNPRTNKASSLVSLNSLFAKHPQLEAFKGMITLSAQTSVCSLLEHQWPDLYKNSLTEHTLKSIKASSWIFSGALDPVTPSYWAKTLLGQLEAPAQLWTDPKAGHGVVSHNLCLHQNIERILQQAHSINTAAVELNCKP